MKDVTARWKAPPGKAMRRILDIYGRSRQILINEGMAVLIRRWLDYLSHRLFLSGTFYVMEQTITDMDEAPFLPKARDFSLHVIGSNRDADELAAAGFDIRRHSVDARQNLDEGAVAFCILVDGKLASIGWVATTEKAKAACDSIPYHVGFPNGYACIGGAVTLPAFRGQGLMTYSVFRRFQYLKERGRLAARFVIAVGNSAPLALHARFGSRKLARARYVKVLWWKYYKETTVTESA